MFQDDNAPACDRGNSHPYHVTESRRGLEPPRLRTYRLCRISVSLFLTTYYLALHRRCRGKIAEYACKIVSQSRRHSSLPISSRESEGGRPDDHPAAPAYLLRQLTVAFGLLSICINTSLRRSILQQESCLPTRQSFHPPAPAQSHDRRSCTRVLN